MYLEKAKSQEAALHEAGFGLFVPCTEEEVALRELQAGHSFPLAYREFLLWMGRWGGGILKGSDCFYMDLPLIQEWARDLLKEDNYPGSLSEKAFVFFLHQGYHILFFHFDEGDDPPVYSYLENEEEPAQTAILQPYDHFSDFLNQTLEKFLIAARLHPAIVEDTNP